MTRKRCREAALYVPQPSVCPNEDECGEQGEAREDQAALSYLLSVCSSVMRCFVGWCSVSGSGWCGGLT
ncbi:hypothetical protein ACF1BP_37655, partial [Streptomyces sp. NPDC014735]|uniref:hypothetical protein n=1 Tax=unclassified Streptomyces TaxID=2593676 RepID=UPI0036F85627